MMIPNATSAVWAKNLRLSGTLANVFVNELLNVMTGIQQEDCDRDKSNSDPVVEMLSIAWRQLCYRTVQPPMSGRRATARVKTAPSADAQVQKHAGTAWRARTTARQIM
ncbi:hypothetical protein [Xanthomonas nasturtii]|uniref:hypothetical protein n=1 Tax=Xanthomonas nasturtii TaxID=1843581 RepID=UPI002013077B|nr:hypothetical protein [Xanthomonas nasturtii]MCL1528426.1 hypothetical protein [Xanthomonas nasturtii]MCL1535563.1 hypothetical protein [Xanthomonas nasturtii]MCL1544307.1 hypothetical protein [Xanthomonas nasturtii]